jgi:hypothetical protein
MRSMPGALQIRLRRSRKPGYARRVRFVVLALLASCEGGRSGPDAAPDAEERQFACARAGSSTVTGSGPDGSLDGAHVYAMALTGFCGLSIELTISHDDPLQWPAIPNTGRVFVSAPGLGEAAPEWSGTFDVEIRSPDGLHPAPGTLVIERGTALTVKPSVLRGMLTTTGAWQLEAAFDVPYCQVVSCF